MAGDILKTIEAANARRVSAQLTGDFPLARLKSLVQTTTGLREYAAVHGFSGGPRPRGCFEDALRRPGMSFICEVKKASPSKGVIAERFPYMDVAQTYERAGADCISCLTEPKWFLGSDDIFMGIRESVGTPMIRKDFTIGRGYGAKDLELGEYQTYQAKLMGADAVLMICSLLDADALRHFLGICDELGLSALVEAHTADEVKMAVDAGARIIGVNNRNLRDFSVDFENAARLRDHIPPDRLYVAESGVKSVDDVAALRRIGADAVLMGEVLMRADDKAGLLTAMRKASR